MVYVNAKGKNCPIPVVMTKIEIENGATSIEVEVDNRIAVDNIKKLAASKGFLVSLNENESSYSLLLEKPVDSPLKNEADVLPSKSEWAVFAGKDVIGSGSRELSENLIKMYFYTLAQSKNRPQYILLMNDGVRLATENVQVIEHLHELEKSGTSILVCGACLNFYGLSDKLEAGQISNMYDITMAMESVSKVVTL